MTLPFPARYAAPFRDATKIRYSLCIALMTSLWHERAVWHERTVEARLNPSRRKAPLRRRGWTAGGRVKGFARLVFTSLFLLVFFGALGGCCPKVHSLDAQTAQGDGGSSSQIVSLSLLQQSFFDQHCVKDCHESANAAANLKLNAGESYANLVNRRSQEIATQIRVIPGKPDESYLIKKLEGKAGIAGNQMPRQSPRPQGEIDQMRAWILRGAPND
jgi:hypothetical protein